MTRTRQPGLRPSQHPLQQQTIWSGLCWRRWRGLRCCSRSHWHLALSIGHSARQGGVLCSRPVPQDRSQGTGLGTVTVHMLPFTVSRQLSRWCNCASFRRCLLLLLPPHCSLFGQDVLEFVIKPEKPSGQLVTYRSMAGSVKYIWPIQVCVFWGGWGGARVSVVSVEGLLL